MKLTSDSRVKEVFNEYPQNIQTRMKHLRKIILDAASAIEGLDKIEETLKWGEPSYLTKHGSTVRMDWKEKAPAQYAVYFKCTSKLVPTFKTLYPSKFNFEGNRAMVFQLDEELPLSELKHCISMALTYHKVKHLPLLGAK